MFLKIQLVSGNLFTFQGEKKMFAMLSQGTYYVHEMKLMVFCSILKIETKIHVSAWRNNLKVGELPFVEMFKILLSGTFSSNLNYGS